MPDEIEREDVMLWLRFKYYWLCFWYNCWYYFDTQWYGKDLKEVDKLAYVAFRGLKAIFAKRKKGGPLINLGGKRKVLPNGINETDVQALLREVKEETGAKLKRGTIVHAFSILAPTGKPGEWLKSKVYFGEADRPLVPQSEIELLVSMSLADAALTTPGGRLILYKLALMGKLKTSPRRCRSVSTKRIFRSQGH